ncbi:NUDIX hydrolase [Treponema pedis]|uniref:NUDIX hydrolase n=1 Tax=Treponema pedis TaxID=409322 RepID=UPI000422AB75|nr:NUDIX hydrolase [Treponema pedis]
MVEIWDAYDKNFRKIENKKLIRGKTIPKGLYHLSCEIIVKHNDGTYLLMQRDLQKHYGGMWELTAGGSALSGETAIECASRELKEETGIISNDLIEIKRIVHEGYQTLYVIYLHRTDLKKNAVILQEGETIGYKWIDKNTLFEMKKDMLASQRTSEIIKESDI